jgi:hypothetical protein
LERAEKLDTVMRIGWLKKRDQSWKGWRVGTVMSRQNELVYLDSFLGPVRHIQKRECKKSEGESGEEGQDEVDK